MARTFDDLLDNLGYGKWNLLYFLANSYWSMQPVPHTLGSAFLAPKAEFTCENPGYPISAGVHNDTDNCHYVDVDDGSPGQPSLHPCTSWNYNTSMFTNTITMQFDLVCDSEYLRATYQSIYMFGSFIGSPISGILSDRFGRKTVFVYGSILFTIVSLASCLLTGFTALLAARFIMGLFHPAGLQAAYILAMETCQPRRRTLVGIVIGVPWAIATMAWGGWAFLIRDWRWLQFAVSAPALLIIPILWILDESPRWLIVSGHHERARKILERAARLNKADLPPAEELDALMKEIESESSRAQEKEEEQVTKGFKGHAAAAWKKFLKLFVLFRTPRIRRTTLLIYVKFFMVSMVFYGISLNAVNFDVNPFLYMVLGGAMEIPAYTLTWPIVEKWGRRGPSITFYFATGAAILALAFVPTSISWLVIVLAMLGKFCISAGFQIFFLYTTELFPTEVRLMALGSCDIASRIGSMTSPFITDLLGPHYPAAPAVVFGIAAFIAGLVTIPLPETHRQPLPDTVVELERFRGKNRTRAEKEETVAMEVND